MNSQKSKSIPIKTAYYITGFADGEGSFNLFFRKRDDLLLGWEIIPVFLISARKRELFLL